MNRSILIGNGMSTMINSEFSYTSLYDRVLSSKQISQRLADIFDAFSTKDFEYILGVLENSKIVISKLDDFYLGNEINALIDECRSCLITAVALTCPGFPIQNLLQPSDVNSVLSSYNTIFTTNYDLYLYWSCRNSNGQYNIFDLFRNCIFSESSINDDSKRILFLHGAMHIFEHGSQTVKIRSRRNEGESGILRQLIENEIVKGHYPLFISEGKSADKFKKIMSNNYLKYCYNYLANIDGELEIFGHSLNEGIDDHILEAICTSNVNKIIYYQYGYDENPNNGEKMRLRIREVYSGIIEIFDSKAHPLTKSWCVFKPLDENNN